MAKLTKAADCRTCKHNSYAHLRDCEFFDCSHPITIAKLARWAEGDPAMVNYRTSDVRIREVEAFRGCPSWEPAGRAALKEKTDATDA